MNGCAAQQVVPKKAHCFNWLGRTYFDRQQKVQNRNLLECKNPICFCRFMAHAPRFLSTAFLPYRIKNDKRVYNARRHPCTLLSNIWQSLCRTALSPEAPVTCTPLEKNTCPPTILLLKNTRPPPAPHTPRQKQRGTKSVWLQLSSAGPSRNTRLPPRVFLRKNCYCSCWYVFALFFLARDGTPTRFAQTFSRPRQPRNHGMKQTEHIVQPTLPSPPSPLAAGRFGFFTSIPTPSPTPGVS